MTQAKIVKAEPEIHPLMKKEISYIGSWKEWKELWEETKQADILHSLLHVGFDIPVDDRKEAIDCILWYFDIADKRKPYFLFRKGDDEDRIFQRRGVLIGGKEANSFEDVRSLLNQKAFQMLCQNFFKNTEKNIAYVPSWVSMATHPQLLKKILWFFRLDEDGRFLNRQYPEDHNTLITAEFLRNFCELIWGCETSSWGARIGEDAKMALRPLRPNTITILFGLRELDLLLRFEKHHGLDRDCMEQIEKLAMSFDLYFPSLDSSSRGEQHRKPRTIEEACFGGSQAARVLLTLRTIQAEKKRFARIR